MKKLSNASLTLYLIVGIVVILQVFLLDPYIKEKYFFSDIDAFKKESWKYSFVLLSILFIIFLIIGLRKKVIDKTFFFSTFVLFLVVAISSKRLTDNVLLYFNSKTKAEKIIKDYIVLRNDENKVFHIYDNKNEFILSEELLRKIDSLRFKRNLKSLYKLQNNDTIKVEYKIGLLDVKYFE